MLIGLLVTFAPTDRAEGNCRTPMCARLGIPPSSSSRSHSRLLGCLTRRCWTCHPEHRWREGPGCQPGSPGIAPISPFLIPRCCRLQSPGLKRNNQTLENSFAVPATRGGKDLA